MDQREIGSGLPSSRAATCSGNCADLPMAPMNRQDADHRHEGPRRARKMHDGVAAQPAGPGSAMGEHLGVVQAAGVGGDQADAEQEAEVADAVDQKGLQVGEDGGGAFVPETDQQEGTRPTASQPKNSCRKLLLITSIRAWRR